MAATALVLTLGFGDGAVRAQAPDAEPGTEEEEVTFVERFGVGGWNVIRVQNKRDGRMRVRGNVELNHVRGDTATPVNYAEAVSSCTDCASFSIALQLNLVQRGAPTVAPWNRAVAANVECTRCVTMARAVQFVIAVDDPDDVPKDVDDLIKDLDKALRRIAQDGRHGDLTAAAAHARISEVIERFHYLATELLDEHIEAPADGT
jgi:hypothetical protein